MKHSKMKFKQKGMALVISMIMLLLLTILGLSSMRTTLMDEKMAGNTRDTELAFQASESGLREAELWLALQTTEPEASGSGANRVWTLNAMDPDTGNVKNWWQERNQAWWVSNGVSTAVPSVNTPPYTIIEYKQFIPDTLLVGDGSDKSGMTYYQVTSRGTGGSDQARILLQSTTTRRY